MNIISKLQQRIDLRSNFITFLEERVKDVDNWWMADNENQLTYERQEQTLDKRLMGEITRLHRALKHEFKCKMLWAKTCGEQAKIIEALTSKATQDGEYIEHLIGQLCEGACRCGGNA